MREQFEIEKAHDAIIPVLNNELPGVKFHISPSQEERMIVALDVLCWVLGHDHNTRFADNLASLLKQLKEKGFELSNLPEPPTPPAA
jgi:hypothetical protein